MLGRLFGRADSPKKKTDHELLMDELFNGTTKSDENKDKYKSIHKYETVNQYKSIHTYGNKADAQIDNITKQPNTVEMFFYYAIIVLSYLLMVGLLPFSLIVCLKKVKENERLVIYRLGRIISREYKPGYCITFPVIDSVKRFSTAQKEFSVPNLQILTHENSIVDLTSIIRYEVFDAIKLMNTLEDLNGTLKSVARGLLINIISKKDAGQVERDKSYIIQDFTNEMNDYIKKWGVKITNVEIKINSVKLDENEGEDPALKTITTVFKSLLGGNSSDEIGTGTSGPKVETPLGQLPNELLKFIEGLSQPMSVPNADLAGSMFGGMFGGMGQQQQQPHPQSSVINMESAASENKMSPYNILKLLEPLINESHVKEIQTVYEFHIQSKNDENNVEIFYLDLKNMTKGKIGPGTSPFSKTDCVIRMTDEDLNELLSDNLKPFTAYMSGRIEIDGDLQDVFKLKKLISTVSQVLANMKQTA